MSKRKARRAAAKAAAEALANATSAPAAPSTATTTPTTSLATTTTTTTMNVQNNNSNTDLATVFKGVDESLLEYYQGLRTDLVNQIISGDTTLVEAASQMSQVVSEVLIDSNIATKEADVIALVQSILQPAAATTTAAGETKEKEPPTNAYTGIAQSSTKRMGRRKTKQQVWMEEKAAKEKKDLAKAKREADLLNLKLEKKTARRKKIKESSAEESERERLLIEAELQEAREDSILARANLGAFKGTLETSDFTLPNPGGGQPLLEDASCTLVRGRRYGLIGRNGTGKSTMLRALASRRHGNFPVNLTVHYVSQEVNLSAVQKLKTPVDIVVDADLERKMLMEESAELDALSTADKLDVEGAARLGECLARLVELESDTAHVRAIALLDSLGFTDELKARPLEKLSGGWRVRTMLAAALFAKPDLLLLDEPTNHLSILAVMWLARELSKSETWQDRIVVIVSHDRHFMDDVCSDVLHISGAARTLTQSRGNYSLWAEVRAQQQVAFAKEVALRQAEIDKLQEYAGHGFKYGGSSSQINKMKQKEKAADKLILDFNAMKENLSCLKEDMELSLDIKSGGELDGYVCQLMNISFAYPNSPTLFTGVEVGITSKSRVVLLGENGMGKTTLVKIMLGHLQATTGDVRLSSHARVALVNQHHADQIDLTLTPLQFMQKLYPGNGSYEHTQKLRSHLAGCGVTAGSGAGQGSKNIDGSAFTGELRKDMQNTPASALSGGQRSRVALAAVSFLKPHILVLDEPTNNLDLEAVAALAESVKKFQGAVICVSHDQFFVGQVANEAWVVSGGRVRQVESFSAYRNEQMKQLKKVQASDGYSK